MGGYSLPQKTVREIVVGSIDVIIQAARLRDGSRRITHITEVIGMEGDVIITQDIVLYNIKGEDANGRLLGEHAQIGENRGVVRLEFERLAVELACIVLLAELVKDGRFRRHQLPVGIFRRLCAAHGVERCLELAIGGQRLAIGGEHVAILGIGDRQFAHHGQRLVGIAVHLQRGREVGCDSLVVGIL